MWSSKTHSLPLNPFVFICKSSLPLSLVWLKASGFFYTTTTINGVSLGLLLDVLLLSHVMEILLLWIHSAFPEGIRTTELTLPLPREKDALTALFHAACGKGVLPHPYQSQK